MLPLHHALAQGDAQAAAALLAAGADPDQPDVELFGKRPLHVAVDAECLRRRHDPGDGDAAPRATLTRMLVEAGADPDLPDQGGRTARHLAQERMHAEALELFRGVREHPWAGRLAILFGPVPHRWGLRGDPHLWAEMELEFRDAELPPTPQAVAERVEEAFARLTGRPMSHPEPFFVPRYDHGGMSGGHVNPAWWRQSGLPLLLERHALQDGTG